MPAKSQLGIKKDIFVGLYAASISYLPFSALIVCHKFANGFGLRIVDVSLKRILGGLCNDMACDS